MTTNVPLIRLVDDDELFRVSQMMLLKTRGWEVECYESGEAFLEKADLKRPGCIILDVRMEGLTGMQVHRELVERLCAENLTGLNLTPKLRQCTLYIG